MSPKEKAKELVDKFMAIKSMKLSDYSLIYYPFAKLCALIAVDEILKVVLIYNDTQAEVTYWQEVKQEIEKL